MMKLLSGGDEGNGNDKEHSDTFRKPQGGKRMNRIHRGGGEKEGDEDNPVVHVRPLHGGGNDNEECG